MITLALASLAAVSLSSAPGSPPRDAGAPGENLALGRPCAIHPAPNYALCTDPEDRRQLTDGLRTSGHFWTQKGTVGWTHPGYATVTIDLGARSPIGGVAVTTAAGAAQVTWPLAIHVLAGEDGKRFRDLGDIVPRDREINGPWPERYAIRRVATDRLRARARFVQIVLIPRSGASYLFTDEIEVLGGDGRSIPEDAVPAGEWTDARTVFERGRLSRAVAARWHADTDALRALIDTAPGLAAAARTRLAERLVQLVRTGADRPGETGAFRAVLPVGPNHAALFSLQALLWKELGHAPLNVYAVNPWDPLDPVAIPSTPAAGTVRVGGLRGETRAGAINLANATGEEIEARLSLEGLDPAIRRSVTVHAVEWTDTGQGVPVAAALPEARRDGETWRLCVRPGLVRQAWLSFRIPEDAPPGESAGSLVIQADQRDTVRVPVRVRVWPMRMPASRTLRVGGWDYADGAGAYGITPGNRDAFLRHLRERGVNAPWAQAAVLDGCTFDPADPDKVRLDTARLDQWLDRWPGAALYCVFYSIGSNRGPGRRQCGGARMGTPEFDRRVGAWISAWVRHLRTRGIGPERLAIHLHDEPHEGVDIGALLGWARAIRAAEPSVILWNDPTYRRPDTAPPALFDACDMFCPNRPMWIAEGDRFARFFLAQRARGRALMFYSCSGPAKLLDPYSYHRLQAWHAFEVGAVGSFFWAFGDNSGASSWNEYLARGGSYTPLFLDDDTVTAGKHMEAIRESAQDYECLAMLRRAAERARAAGRADAATRAADDLLRHGPAEVLRDVATAGLQWREPKDRGVADRVRFRILDALEALAPAGSAGHP